MASKDQLMLETKETLATRLANRSSNGGGTSIYNPLKADGIKLVTLGQEIGIVGCITEDSGEGRPWAHLTRFGDLGTALKLAVQNVDPRKSFSGKILVGSTAVGLGANFLKRRNHTIKAGLFKLN